MNRQDIFDRVATHLLTQNAKAFTVGEGCKYLTDNGLKCAIGCLIEGDDEFLKSLASSSVYATGVQDALRHSGIDVSWEPDLFFLMDLQRIHDDSFVKEWPGRLFEFAGRYDLDTQSLSNGIPRC